MLVELKEMIELNTWTYFSHRIKRSAALEMFVLVT